MADPVLILRANRYSGAGAWVDESPSAHTVTTVGTPAWDGEKWAITASNRFSVADSADFDVDLSDGQTLTVVTVVDYIHNPGGEHQFVRKHQGGTTPGWKVYINTANPGTPATLVRDVAGQQFPVAAAMPASDVTKTVQAGVIAATHLRYNNGTPGSGVANTSGDLSNSQPLLIGHATDSRPFNCYGVYIDRDVLNADQIAAAAAMLVEPPPSPFGPAQKLLLLGVG